MWATKKLHPQMILIVSQLIFEKLIAPCFSIIGEIEEVDDVVLLLLDGLPANIDDFVKSEGFMVGLPARPYKDWI